MSSSIRLPVDEIVQNFQAEANAPLPRVHTRRIGSAYAPDAASAAAAVREQTRLRMAEKAEAVMLFQQKLEHRVLDYLRVARIVNAAQERRADLKVARGEGRGERANLLDDAFRNRGLLRVLPSPPP
jgi:hypothetical protein